VPRMLHAVRWRSSAAWPDTHVPRDFRIEFRIGIQVGDIINNDIFGDGVNIAARLEGLAEAGGVCISDDAQRQIRGKLDIAFDDMGVQTLKNIAEPMRTWRTRLGVAEPPTPVGPPPIAGRSWLCLTSPPLPCCRSKT
jgi:adenylate cyclase